MQREVVGGLTLGASDATGRVFCNSARIPPGGTISWRRYFHDAMRTNDFVVGEYAVGGATGLPSIHFAYPVRDEGRTPIGVVFLPLSLKWLHERMSKLLGHRLTLKSAAGQGSTFVIAVPLGPATGTATRAAPRFTFSGTVLVLDDEPLVAEATADLLRFAGATVHVAHTADDALRIARDTPLQVVVADHRLPVSSGLAVVQHILREQPNATAVLITADTLSAELGEIADPRIAVLYKPVSLQSLASALQRT